MWQEFRKFIMRGNVIDLAVGVIVGSAFSKIVTSLVNDVIMPPIGLLIGKVDFSNLFISLSWKQYHTLKEAKDANVATINYGTFISNVLDFLIVSFVIFLAVRQVNKLQHRNDKPVDPKDKECPYCCSKIDKKAVRCPHCTSELDGQDSPHTAVT